jgi:hypothetical protein
MDLILLPFIGQYVPQCQSKLLIHCRLSPLAVIWMPVRLCDGSNPGGRISRLRQA